MPELVSPAQSEIFILVVAFLATVVGAFVGWRAAGKRGLAFALAGPLLFGAWRAHSYVTRFDPQTGYFGLDKVSVLLLEVVAAVVLGVVLGCVWNKVAVQK